jgi:hypothetical protein
LGTGFGATVAAGAISGAVTGQATIAGDNFLAGGRSLAELTSGLGNPADMVRDAATGAAGAALGYGIAKLAKAVIGKVGGSQELPVDVPCNSFTADTPVLSDGGLVPIGQVEVGDQVWAWDETSGLTNVYTVTAVLLNYDPVQTALVISGEVIQTTPEHPFWTEERGWVEAGDLQTGEHVWRADGTVGEVWTTLSWHEARWMYNLTVATAHTYFVGHGQWLVHNASCPIIGRPDANRTAAHEAAQVGKANEMAASGDYDKVWMNTSLDDITAGVAPMRSRPDVVGRRLDGSFDLFEVRSPSQPASYLRQQLRMFQGWLERSGLEVNYWEVLEP